MWEASMRPIRTTKKNHRKREKLLNWLPSVLKRTGFVQKRSVLYLRAWTFHPQDVEGRQSHWEQRQVSGRHGARSWVFLFSVRGETFVHCPNSVLLPPTEVASIKSHWCYNAKQNKNPQTPNVLEILNTETEYVSQRGNQRYL